jgi:uncharacterized protein with von Willebrand factor type A (vWA) domain
VYIIQFSDGVKSWEFKRGIADSLEYLTDSLTFFFDGGTRFEQWMGKAISLIETSAYNRADVIIISDGEAYVGDKMLGTWNQLKEERGLHCYGVLIGSSSGHGVMANLCEKENGLVVLQDAMRDSEKAFDMLFTIE